MSIIRKFASVGIGTQGPRLYEFCVLLSAETRPILIHIQIQEHCSLAARLYHLLEQWLLQ